MLNNESTVAFARSNAEIAYTSSELYVGSYRKSTMFMRASIFNFFIVPNAYDGFYNISSKNCPNSASICPTDIRSGNTIELNACSVMEYNDGDSCQFCHSTCVHGCEDGSKCKICHNDCATCVDETANSCLTCHSGS